MKIDLKLWIRNVGVATFLVALCLPLKKYDPFLYGVILGLTISEWFGIFVFWICKKNKYIIEIK